MISNLLNAYSLVKESKAIHEGSWMKKVVGTGKWYLLASLLTKGLGVFLLPLYTEHLSTAEYGLFNTINSIALLLPLVVSLCLDSAFGRFYHDYKNDKERLASLFSTIYWFVLGFGILSIALVLYSGLFWSEDLLGVSVYPLLYLALIPILFLQLGTLGISYLRQSLEAKRTGAIQVGATLLKFIVIVPLLVTYQYGISAILIGNAVSSAAIFIYMTYLMSSIGILQIRFSSQVLKMAIIYSLPLLPGFAGTWVNSMVDRLIIAKYDSMAGVGIYSFAFQIGLIIYMIGDAITNVISPISMSGFVDNIVKVKPKMVKVSLQLLSVMGIFAIGSILFGPDIIAFLGSDDYKDAEMILPIIIIPFLWGMQYRFFVITISYFKKTWILTFASLVTAFINLILNLIYVPEYGYIVGPITTFISSFIYFLILLWFSQRLHRINYDTGRIISIFLICILSCILIYYLDWLELPKNLFLLIMLKLLFFLLFSFMILRIGKIRSLNLKMYK